MRKYILFIMSIALLALTACNEDMLDKINEDKQHPAPDAVPAYLQLSEAIMSTGFTTVSGDYAFYLSSLNEQEIGVGNNQFLKAELRNSNEWSASTTFNNVWNSTYGNLFNIREMIRKIETEVPGNVGQFDLLGMAQVLEALEFGILTDMHGDIPYSQALLGQANLQPKLDAQKDVYAGILSTLDKAIANFEKGNALKSAGNQDILLGGKVQQWKALAYALKARYLLHKLAVEPGVLSQVEKNAQEAVNLGFEGASIKEFNETTHNNPWTAFVWSRNYTASSKTVGDLMQASNDPRFKYYTKKTGKTYPTGNLEIAQVADGSLAFPAWYDLGSQPLHLFSKSELYFILAEVQLRLGKDATQAFRVAVETSVSEILSLFGDDTSASEFAASLGTPTLKKLFEQKYIAQSYDEQIEAYNDLRRLKAMGETYVKLTNPMNVQSGLNRYPEMLPYGNSAVLGNPNVKTAYGDGNYIYTKKMWLHTK